MRKVALIAALMVLTPAAAYVRAQSLDDLNIQIHGYATQGFLYTTQNNIFTTTSSHGSPAWTEAVLNVGAQPESKLHIGVQGRYFMLGNYGNSITLDWAAVDYKAGEQLGFRFGKVKTPWGLFNEIQDIDPAYIWTMLPMSIYPLSDRNSYLTHYGGIVYGTFDLNHAGRIDYRGYAGEGVYPANDGYYIEQAEAGYNLPNDIHGALYGAALHWRTPLRGLMVGVSDLSDERWSAVQTYTSPTGTLTGTYTLPANSQPNYFAQYQRKKLMIAFEYQRSWGDETNVFPGQKTWAQRNDDRGLYAMATWKLTQKLTAGVYNSQNSDRQASPGPDRYSKDWAFSARYDFTTFLYAKAEEHLIDGDGLGYDSTLNPDLKPNTRLTALKIGVSF
jgi:hypothetical protein